MPVQLPTIDDLAELAADYELSLELEDLESFQSLMAGNLASYNRLDELAEPSLPVAYPRSPVFVPSPRTIRSTPGTGGAKSRARRPGRCWARRWRSRITCVWRACR